MINTDNISDSIIALCNNYISSDNLHTGFIENIPDWKIALKDYNVGMYVIRNCYDYKVLEYLMPYMLFGNAEMGNEATENKPIMASKDLLPKDDPYALFVKGLVDKYLFMYGAWYLYKQDESGDIRLTLSESPSDSEIGASTVHVNDITDRKEKLILTAITQPNKLCDELIHNQEDDSPFVHDDGFVGDYWQGPRELEAIQLQLLILRMYPFLLTKSPERFSIKDISNELALGRYPSYTRLFLRYLSQGVKHIKRKTANRKSK